MDDMYVAEDSGDCIECYDDAIPYLCDTNDRNHRFYVVSQPGDVDFLP
jgi:hypothetical protein